MRTKLIKKKDGWYNLYNEDIGIGSTHEDLQPYKISLKNCQAIEQDSPLQEYVLEVNGEGWDDHLYRGSRKQTEWDIEIVMECCGKVYSQHCDGTCEHVKPLLDADGCLILKRI